MLTRGVLVVAIWAIVLVAATGARAGQIGAILAPGPLSKAHASLEGVGSCAKCHDSRDPSAEKCLTCHKPVAQRIARKTGVHRALTAACWTCHAEHRGADADIRRFDTQTFNHTAETGFALEASHAPLAQKCAACHPKRTFLEARGQSCSPCHNDVHKSQLGTNCARCHSTSTPFKQTRKAFDHNRAQFVLTGAHQKVECQKCHVGGQFADVRHDMCSACHQEPHRKIFGPTCTSCHNTEAWATRAFDHGRTGFTLVGAHTQVACAKCHPSGMTKQVRFDQCSACHVNVHRQSVKEDCRACHDERTFRGASFDHRVKTTFALVGKHDGLACRKCHTSITTEDLPLARRAVDFGGLKKECASCHEDKHKGEYGRTCDACHRPTKFNVTGFTHPKAPEFFGDQHAPVKCVNCHVRAQARAVGTAGASAAPSANPPSMECRACHTDVHLGQLGTTCERCHAINGVKFAPTKFSHERGAFPLTGRHVDLDCVKCHPAETRAFPAGTGTAKRVNPMPSECKACHKDPHLGQVEAPCKTCHTTTSFKIFSYPHRGLSPAFTGLHGTVKCQACHKSETGTFPAGQGTAVRFKLGTSCVECHPRF